MARGRLRSFWLDDQGAVAATYVLALPALIILAGVGFDYARMASMDSELQNAADQAALAGVTQLDGQPGACQRAADAARQFVNNASIMSNDQDFVTLPEIDVGEDCDGGDQFAFWQDAAKTIPATSDENAEFIEVTVSPETVTYALTPVSGAVFGATLRARAMAGIGAAICKAPPVMMCNPVEPAGNIDVLLDFDADAYKGVGIRLVANDAYTPGSFGFLETGYGSGANNLLAALGWTAPPGDCVSTEGVEIKNGMNAAVMDGINTRFDIPGTGNSCPDIDGVTGSCPPSLNVRKGLVRGNTCNGPNAWTENASNNTNFATRNYRPTAYGVLPSGTTPQIMGHPRDMCHAWGNVGDCNARNGGQGERIGTGDWDINAYWRSNYGANYGGQVSVDAYGSQPKGYPTRYQVYRWEADNYATTIGVPVPGQGSTFEYGQPQSGICRATATAPYGIVPTDEVDRRRLTVAVLNCNALTALHGNLNNAVLDVGRRNWINMFLVEPSRARTRCTSGAGCNARYSEATDVYVEIIGRTDTAAAEQTVMKNTPYLIQ
jgi:Flp pilus assembly protein TadG